MKIKSMDLVLWLGGGYLVYRFLLHKQLPQSFQNAVTGGESAINKLVKY